MWLSSSCATIHRIMSELHPIATFDSSVFPPGTPPTLGSCRKVGISGCAFWGELKGKGPVKDTRLHDQSEPASLPSFQVETGSLAHCNVLGFMAEKIL